MSKSILATIAGIIAIAAAATPAAADKGKPIIVQKPAVHANLATRPLVKTVVQPVFHKPLHSLKHRPIVVLGHAHAAGNGHGYGYNGGFKYYPFATYSSAPDDCMLVVFKDRHGIYKKAWKCRIVDYRVSSLKIIDKVIDKPVLVRPAASAGREVELLK